MNLYLKNPTRQQLGNRLKKINQTLENLKICEKDQAAFVRRFVLGDEQAELRGMCLSCSQLAYPWDKITNALYGNQRVFVDFSINPLAVDYLQRQAELYALLLTKKEDHPFEKCACKRFGQQVPQDPSRWLDGSHEAPNNRDLQNWMAENVGKSMGTDAEKNKFSRDFRSKYEAAYGPRKGSRSDRPTWGLSTIKKILTDLNLGYKMESDRGVWRLTDSRTASL